jgi:hypothetical protein
MDLTTRILLEKYQPNSPLLQVVVSEPEPVEVEKTSITMEELLLKVRSELLTKWGLDPEGRHLFADDIVTLATVQKCKEYTVIDLPEEWAV